MNRIRIEIVAVINNRIFVVYYSPGKCYQFSILDEYGCAYDFPDILNSAEAAEIEARKTTNTLSDQFQEKKLRINRSWRNKTTRLNNGKEG